MAWVRYLILVLTVLSATPVRAQTSTSGWLTVSGGANLVRPVFWEGIRQATATDRGVEIEADDDSGLVVDRYGPRLHVAGDFRVVASLQTANPDLAALSLVDAVPEDEWGPAMRRVELGFQHGQIVVSVFDGTSPAPTDQAAFDVDPPLGPVTLSLSREAADLVVEQSGTELTRIVDPGIFSTGSALLGTHTAAGNTLTLATLDVQAPADRPSAVRVDRCAPPRLLVAGADQTDVYTGLWWIWPDDNRLRQVESSENQRSFLVAISPDNQWVLYYQRSSVPSDRFIVDTWVMNLTTDERYKLVDNSAPLGWVADSTGVVLGERPYLMARVPSGQLVPVVGQLVLDQAMHSAASPDGTLRASVATMPTGAAGINIYPAGSSEPSQSIATGRGAVELAWSPDSSQLAYTSGVDSPDGLIWRLRLFDLATGNTSVLDTPGDLQLHSVIWAPRLAGCQ